MKIVVLALAALLAGPALAETPSITVAHPWLRATPNTAPVAGGYATITNSGAAADTLVSASLPIAAEGQIHSMTMSGGVMHMRRLDAGLPIAAGATVTLAPGGDHLMFIKPTRQLKEGEHIEGSLTFAKAGKISVAFVVGGMAARSAPGTRPPQHQSMPGMDMR